MNPGPSCWHHSRRNLCLNTSVASFSAPLWQLDVPWWRRLPCELLSLYKQSRLIYWDGEGRARRVCVWCSERHVDAGLWGQPCCPSGKAVCPGVPDHRLSYWGLQSGDQAGDFPFRSQPWLPWRWAAFEGRQPSASPWPPQFLSPWENLLTFTAKEGQSLGLREVPLLIISFLTRNGEGFSLKSPPQHFLWEWQERRGAKSWKSGRHQGPTVFLENQTRSPGWQGWFGGQGPVCFLWEKFLHTVASDTPDYGLCHPSA